MLINIHKMTIHWMYILYSYYFSMTLNVIHKYLYTRHLYTMASNAILITNVHLLLGT